MTEKEELAKLIAIEIKNESFREDFIRTTCEYLGVDYKLVEDKLKEQEECCG